MDERCVIAPAGARVHDVAYLILRLHGPEIASGAPVRYRIVTAVMAMLLNGTTVMNERGDAAPRDPRDVMKRAIDVVGSGVLLLLLAPIMVGVAAAVRWHMGTPVLFRQQRPGRQGVPFTLYKFRTMTHATAPDGAPLADSQRLTRFGQWLRSTSLDELPQILNVLRGDMSLVGPRPLLLEYLPRYSTRQRRRHEVRPGLTGLAQVSGRNELSWQERLELDVRYVEHWSLTLDARILLRTLRQVFRRRGIQAAGHVTMPTFPGNDAANS